MRIIDKIDDERIKKFLSEHTDFNMTGVIVALRVFNNGKYFFVSTENFISTVTPAIYTYQHRAYTRVHDGHGAYKFKLNLVMFSGDKHPLIIAPIPKNRIDNFYKFLDDFNGIK